MVNVIVWLVLGGLVGWLTSMVMKTDDRHGIVMNVLVGIVGSVVAGWMVSPLVGAGTLNQGGFSPPSLVVSFVGALLLLAIVNLFRHTAVR